MRTKVNGQGLPDKLSTFYLKRLANQSSRGLLSQQQSNELSVPKGGGLNSRQTAMNNTNKKGKKKNIFKV